MTLVSLERERAQPRRNCSVAFLMNKNVLFDGILPFFHALILNIIRCEKLNFIVKNIVIQRMDFLILMVEYISQSYIFCIIHLMDSFHFPF